MCVCLRMFRKASTHLLRVLPFWQPSNASLKFAVVEIHSSLQKTCFLYFISKDFKSSSLCHFATVNKKILKNSNVT